MKVLVLFDISQRMSCQHTQIHSADTLQLKSVHLLFWVEKHGLQKQSSGQICTNNTHKLKGWCDWALLINSLIMLLQFIFRMLPSDRLWPKDEVCSVA